MVDPAKASNAEQFFFMDGLFSILIVTILHVALPKGEQFMVQIYAVFSNTP